jgi:hypothetical protein
VEGAVGPNTPGLFVQVAEQRFIIPNYNNPPISIIPSGVNVIGQMGYPSITVGDTFCCSMGGLGVDLNQPILFPTQLFVNAQSDQVAGISLNLFPLNILIPNPNAAVYWRFQVWFTVRTAGDIYAHGTFTWSNFSTPSSNGVQVGQGSIAGNFTGGSNLVFNVLMKALETANVFVRRCNLTKLY